MEKKVLEKSSIKIINFISVIIPILAILLILNWLLKITPYQKLQGIPLLIAPLISLAGFTLGCISYRKSPNNLAIWSIIINSLVFVSPFFYWFLGILILGP